MVMKRNAMRKNLRQSIFKSLGRYIAIVAIIALGASMFVGLLMTKTDMVATGQKYMDEQNMFDLRLVSTLGWTGEQLEQIAQMEGVEDAEGLRYLDVIASLDGAEENSVYRFYSIPERVNLVALRGGRMPEKSDECLADGFHTTDDILGMRVTVAESNDEDTLDALVYKTYTVVGYVASPLYMDLNRGTTSVGSGSLTSYFYIPEESFDMDYYPEINLTIPGDYEIYSEEYNDAMEAAADELLPELEALAEQRLRELKSEAVTSYRDGRLEYFNGLNEYQQEKEKALKELDDAYQQLQNAQREITAGEQALADGEAQLDSARQTLNDGIAELEAGRQEFEQTKSESYALLDPRRERLENQLQQIDAELEPINSQIAQIDSKLQEFEESRNPEVEALESRISQLDVQLSALDASIQASEAALDYLNQYPILNALLIRQTEETLRGLYDEQSALMAQRAELVAQRDALVGDQTGTSAEQMQLLKEKIELQSRKSILEMSREGVQQSLSLLEAAYAVLDKQFAEAEQELIAGEAQIESGKEQLAQAEEQLASSRRMLANGKIALAEGLTEYENGKAEAEEKFAEAEAELADAKKKLDDALLQIMDLSTVDVFVLNRSSNVGYGSLDSSSDIVAGISRVFPAFFLLVASLVCITTMTRMIDEERTQIGTLKALGYSNGAIISKYLVYAGSGALVGCGLGVLVGSVVFPTILWEVYKIMLHITPGLVLKVNWLLCGAVVLAYTSVMLLVTWYCCRKSLREEPAELIRPKAPEVGRKILLERLPFWHRISFLNKVTIRNIFRYRQRLAMMMVGIGGCTALLVTGFGLRDSIVNVVDYQFEEVTVYDLQVYFSEGQSEGSRYQFEGQVGNKADNVMFYHQESVELDFDNETQEIYLMAAESEVRQFIDFHDGDEKLSMPGRNEVMLSVGVAEAMGINVGDEVKLRNADMQQLELTVSGIYDNHVYNYAIVIPETLEEQWEQTPDLQMALLQVAEGQDVYALGAQIAGFDGVMNVAISEELAEMVGSMMDALDLVVIVIVVCAGLLAAIVLYNLTNININERIREIATIKVLGFRSGETGAYVFKENLSLSVIGSLLGLGLGYLLLIFVMSEIKINMVWFKPLIMPESYVISVVLTMVTACIVDFIFYFKLEKINMAEALKSVE